MYDQKYDSPYRPMLKSVIGLASTLSIAVIISLVLAIALVATRTTC